MSDARFKFGLLKRLRPQPLAALFPPTCWATGQSIAPSDKGLCREIQEQLRQQLLWPYCQRCGSTLGPFAARGSCQNCPHRKIGLDRIVRVGTLNGPLSRLIHSMKFARHWALAAILAPWMAEALRHAQVDAVDQFVPVPLHWSRQWRRGFNQAFELASELSGIFEAPCDDLLRRKRATIAQTAMQNATARLDNVRGAFILPSRVDLSGLNIWLVDDVCTTGATLHAAAAALRNVSATNRPASISAIVLAVADAAAIPDSPNTSL
ncbi:MAG: ComF family protein [Phycisphaerae bacterium]